MPTACCACIVTALRFEALHRATSSAHLSQHEQRPVRIIQVQPRTVKACGHASGPSPVLRSPESPCESPSGEEGVSDVRRGSANMISPLGGGQLCPDNTSQNSSVETVRIVKICTEVTQTTEVTELSDGEKKKTVVSSSLSSSAEHIMSVPQDGCSESLTRSSSASDLNSMPPAECRCPKIIVTSHF